MENYVEQSAFELNVGRGGDFREWKCGSQKGLQRRSLKAHHIPSPVHTRLWELKSLAQGHIT
jgi:hypothetical protein